MEKIKLTNNKKIEITTNGISSSDTTLTIELYTSMTIGEIDNLFSNSENTEKIELLSDNDETLKIYNGYNTNLTVSKDSTTGIIIVEQYKQSDIESRIIKLEQTQADQDTAIMDLANAIGGEE